MLTHETLMRIPAIGRHPQDPSLQIDLPRQTRTRLNARHFRGRTIPRAGNFKRWDTVHGCVRDLRKEIIRTATQTLRELRAEGHEAGIDSLELTMPYAIGWDTIADLSNFDGETFDERSIRGHEARAWFVRPESKHLAPLTRKITVVYRVHRFPRSSAWIATILSLRPGPDLGALRGNVTHDLGIVLFDWEHPGVSP